jgi:hypothetical protein
MTVHQRPLRRLQRSLAIALLVLFGSGITALEARAEEIVTIVNESNPLTAMSIHRLRLVYALYQRTWSGGIRVHLVLPAPESRAMEFLVSKVFRKSYDWEIDRYYIQAVFQQRIAKRPPQLPAKAAIARVRSDPGAIALVDRDEITDGSGLRILPMIDD